MSDALAVPPARPASRFRGVVLRLGAVNALIAASALVTGPVLAHALGAEGRGLVAAIAAPLGFVPTLAAVGLPAYAASLVARGRDGGRVVGSALALAFAFGLLAAVAGYFAAPPLAEGRHDIEQFLRIGFALMPLLLPGAVALGAVNGLGRWRALAITRLIPAVSWLVGLVVLAAIGELTVDTAAALLIAGMAVAAVWPLATLFRALRWSVARATMHAALAFGFRAWTGSLAALTNQRLDLLVMIPLVPTRELGFYAVAVSLTALSGMLAGAVAQAVLPRAAAGEAQASARATRVTLALVALGGAALAALVPWGLPILFGSDFDGAVAPALILLAASVPAAGRGILTTILLANERPSRSSAGELLGVIVTVPGLVVALPALGASGAALVSLASYTVCFAYLLWGVADATGLGRRAFLVPSAADVRALVAPVHGAIERWRGRT